MQSGAATGAVSPAGRWRLLLAPPWSGRILLGLTLIGALFYLLIRWMAVVWLGDDGIFFSGAQRLVRGEVVYRDFSLHITPGTFYLLAAALKCGGSWETTRFLWLLVTLIQGAAVFLMIERLTRSAAVGMIGFGIVTAWAVVNPVFLHHHLSTTLALGSTWAWWRWVESRRLPLAFAAGLLDGLVGFTSQNKGFFLLLASLTVILLLDAPGWRARGRTLLAYAVGGGSIAVLFGAQLWIQGSAAGFYRDCVQWVLTGYGDSGRLPYAASLGFLETRRGLSYPSNLVLAVWIAACAPASALIEGGLGLASRRLRPLQTLLAVQGLALWAGALHRPDLLDHLRLSSHLPTVLLLAQLHQGVDLRKLGAGQARKAAGFLCLLALLVLGAACVGSVQGLAKEGLDETRIPLRTLGPRAWTPNARLARTIEGLDGYLSERAGAAEPIFALPWSPLYYVLLRRPNATKYDLPAEVPGWEAQIGEVIDQLERKKVRFVIVDGLWTPELEKTLYPGLKRSFLKGRLMDYIERAYEIDARFPLATAWRRKAD